MNHALLNAFALIVVAAGLWLAVFIIRGALRSASKSLPEAPTPERHPRIERRVMPHVDQIVDETLEVHRLYPNGMTHDQAYMRMRWAGVSDGRARALLAGEKRAPQ